MDEQFSLGGKATISDLASVIERTLSVVQKADAYMTKVCGDESHAARARMREVIQGYNETVVFLQTAVREICCEEMEMNAPIPQHVRDTVVPFATRRTAFAYIEHIYTLLNSIVIET